MARLFILVKEWQGNFKRINQIIKDIENNFNDNPKGFNEWMNIRSNKKYSMKWKKIE